MAEHLQQDGPTTSLKRPELVISAGSLEEMKRYIEAGADAVQIGDAAYAERLPGSMNTEEIGKAVQYAHEHGAKVYVVINKIIDHTLLEGLGPYVQALADCGVDAIVFGDPAIWMAVRERQLPLRLHWSAEMTTTNYMTANFWASKGSVRTLLSRELNLQEIADFKQHTVTEVQVQVHGMTNIYHSKRRLVDHYMNYQGRKLQPVREAGKIMYLIEKERPDERYPIIETEHGTHIMSSDDICMLECLDEILELGIDAFYIESLLKSLEYNETVVRMYRQAIDAWCADRDNYECQEEWIDAIYALQDPDRELSFGFLFKEQVY